MSSPTPSSEESAVVRGPITPRKSVLYPNCYIWYIFMAAMDIMMTFIILGPAFDGVEVNWLADVIMRAGGFYAAIAFKLGIVALVIGICEVVGRHNDHTGRKLAEWSVAITAIPVIVSFLQLLIDLGAITIWTQQKPVE